MPLRDTSLALDQLSDDLRDLVISLPYRVGYYISVSDKTGGAQSDELELRALENSLTYFVEDTLKSEFAQNVMQETLKARGRWQEWRAEIKRVPHELKEINTALPEYLEQKDYVSFKSNLLEIAETVAMAYQEHPTQTMTQDGFWSFLKFFLKGSNQNSQPQLSNISQAEQKALEMISSELGFLSKAN